MIPIIASLTYLANKCVILQGLSDYIVVDSGEVLLVCNKKDEQMIKQFVNDVKIKLGENQVMI